MRVGERVRARARAYVNRTTIWWRLVASERPEGEREGRLAEKRPRRQAVDPLNVQAICGRCLERGLAARSVIWSGTVALWREGDALPRPRELVEAQHRRREQAWRPAA